MSNLERMQKYGEETSRILEHHARELLEHMEAAKRIRATDSNNEIAEMHDLAAIAIQKEWSTKTK